MNRRLTCETSHLSRIFTIFEDMPEIQRMITGRPVTRLDAR